MRAILTCVYYLSMDVIHHDHIDTRLNTMKRPRTEHFHATRGDPASDLEKSPPRRVRTREIPRARGPAIPRCPPRARDSALAHARPRTMFTVVARAHIAPVTKASAKHTKAHAKAAAKPAIAKAFDRVKLPALTLAMQAASMVPAAHAEAGKLFDFDLTLPIIATEFLLLMTILDKTVFGPVGKALDDRDELIRSQLAAVGDNSTEVDNLIVRLRELVK